MNAKFDSNFKPPRGFRDILDDDPVATARWQDGESIVERLPFDPKKRDRLFLGYLDGKRRRRNYLGAPIDDRHGMTIAGSRAGKGASFIIPNLLTYPGSVIANDPKAELAQVTSRRRRELGQDVAILDPFRESGFADHDLAALNPLDIIDPEDESAADEAGLLADALIIQEKGSGQHFTMAARNLLHGVILHVALTCIGQDRTLPYMRELIAQNIDDLLGENGLIDQMVETGNNPMGRMCAQAANSFAGKSDNERSSVLSTALEQTAFLASPAMKRGLARSTFNIDGLKTAKNGLSVYLCLPARRLDTHSRFLRLILTVAVARMEAVPNVSARQPTATFWPVLFMLDEFPALGHLQVIERAAGLMAGYGVKLWTVLQDISQLKRDYPHSWETFMGNAGLIQAFGTSDESTCAQISKLCGETETLSLSLPELSERQRGEGLSGLNRSVTVAPLLRPDEVRRFFARETGRQLILFPGAQPFAIQRAAYFDPDHKKLFGGLYE